MKMIIHYDINSTTRTTTAVIAKFEKWLRQQEMAFQVWENAHAKCLQVTLILEKDKHGKYVFPLHPHTAIAAIATSPLDAGDAASAGY